MTSDPLPFSPFIGGNGTIVVPEIGTSEGTDGAVYMADDGAGNITTYIITSDVPEPSTLLLVVTGLLGLRGALNMCILGRSAESDGAWYSVFRWHEGSGSVFFAVRFEPGDVAHPAWAAAVSLANHLGARILGDDRETYNLETGTVVDE